MNRLGLTVAGVAAALVLACGPNPITYLVALDQSSLASLPGSCYPGGTVPTPAPNVTPFVQHEFTVWEGAQGKRYLQIDQVRVNFPTSNNFTFVGLAQGGPKTWSYSTSVDRPNTTTESRTLELTFTDLGPSTLLGSAVATSTCSCPAAPCSCVDCTATFQLNGRAIEVERQR